MFRSFRLGRLFGFPIEINFTFLLLLAVVGIWMGGLAGIFTVLVAFGSVVLHELGHALVARHLGVPVSGIELYFFGGAAKMVGQPRRAGDEIAIAAAGPAVSFALAGVGTLLAALSGVWFFQLFAWINLFIGAFNLVPALPMDGGRILRAALSGRFGYRRATEISVVIARGFAIVLGIAGLVTLNLHLVLLAGVLWFLGTTELRAAKLYGRTRGYGLDHSGGFATGLTGAAEAGPSLADLWRSLAQDRDRGDPSREERGPAGWWRGREPRGSRPRGTGREDTPAPRRRWSPYGDEDEPQVMPRGWRREGGSVPRSSSGFVIRRRGGRVTIDEV